MSIRKWKILISDEQKVFHVDKIKLKALAKAILSAVDSAGIPASTRELSILLTDDERIRDLNSSFRGKNKPTDVLSFSQLEGRGGNVSRSLGDIVISIEYAEREAEKRQMEINEEVMRLLVHGVLHLCGFEHEKVSPKERQRMKRQETNILNSLAISPILRKNR